MPPPRISSKSDIAVIGLACYYPGASNILELWENILARRIQFRRMLDQRLPLKDYYDEDPKASEKTYVTKAAFLENFKFDWSKSRIPKKTFESTDIVHWLALDTALKALEDARYKISGIPIQNTGVIVGNTLTGEQTRSQTLRLRWPYVQKVLNATLTNLGLSSEDRSHVSIEMERSYKSAFYPITEDSLAGGLSNTIAGRICNYLNFKGGGYIVDGACSSSLLAVATAATALKTRDMDLALAGGVDVSLDPFELVGFAKVGALAKDKMSVYDRQANGFLPGEGCGFVVLKRLEDAVRDHNYIYAVINGWGISSDGKGGIMEPSSTGQALAIQRAYKDTHYKISDVDFIEGHGTGTSKGDRVELEGIAAAIQESGNKSEKRSCGITSFKSIVGHTKAAAGIGSLIKAILAVNQRVLPPTANCKDPNEVFREKEFLYPIIQGEYLPRNKTVRAGISSAGFGGINCHVAIESKDKPSEKIKPKIEERSLFVSNQKTEVFVFSSRTINYLRNIIQKFKEDLRNISIAEMADLAALLNKKVKSRLPIKGAIVTNSPEHLYEALSSVEIELENISLPEGHIRRIKTSYSDTYIIIGNAVKKNRIGFLYPGQGSQRLNMTRRFVERFKWARDLLNLSTLPLFDYIYKPTDKFIANEDQEEFRNKLNETQITQPAVIFSSLVWTGCLSKLGIEPYAVSGHSLGELAAFYKAGAFNKKTLMQFAEFRGKLMAATGQSAGGMASLFCPINKAKELVDKVRGNIVLANINSPKQVVVSGGKKEIEQIIEMADKEGISAYRLNVSNAFHSLFMKEAAKKLKSAPFLKRTFKPKLTDLYSCVDGQKITDEVNLAEYFANQTLSSVNFIQLVETMSKNCDVLIEVGPGRVLTDLVKAVNTNNGFLCFPVESSSENDRDLNVVLAEVFVRNVQVRWEELYRDRLIRPFVPASRKKFIENQCERPLDIIVQKKKPTAFEIKTVERFVGDAKGPLSEEEAKEGETIFKGKDDIADLLIDLTHKTTGFEKSSISLDFRLLDDLNIDSIKAAELIAEASKVLGIAGKLDPSQLSNNTLAQIRDRLQELIGQQSSIKNSASSKVQASQRYQHNTWVKNFIVELKHQEISTKDVNGFKNFRNILIVSGGEDRKLVQEIQKSFKLVKAQFQSFSYKDILNDNLDELSDVDCMVFVLPNIKKDRQLDKTNLRETIERLHKVIALSTQGITNQERTVAFVQFGFGSFGDNKLVKNIESCCARSIASTLHLERPDLRIRIMDFDPCSPEQDVANRIIGELQTTDSFSIAGYDSELRRKVPIYEKSEPVYYEKRKIKWSDEDVVLVTGGAKGITAECTLEFAKSTKAQMVLIGRSPVPIDSKDRKNEVTNTLSRFEKENLKVKYYQCDITNEGDVNKLIQEIHKKFGKIKGFIHGAGLNSLKRLKQATTEEAYQGALPKIIGALNILNALKKTPPTLIMAMTSVIGVTGMDGSGWYGFANEVLNLLLKQFSNQHKETQIQTIAYSIWDEVGMGVRLGGVDRLYERGIAAIPVSEGVKRFKQLAECNSGTQQVIVVARIAGLDTWRALSIEYKKDFRFIEDIKYFLPEVELIARARLNVRDDSYLSDHNWKGSLLFPFVFGLEAMTQAVAHVMGNSHLKHLKIRNINLEKPIPVNPDVGTTIEIHAEVLQIERLGDCTKVKVEIYSEQTNYQQPHFSAIYELDQRNKIPKRIETNLWKSAKKFIDLNPKTDLYGPILFQGKLFQCIDKIQELYYKPSTKKGECACTIAYDNSSDNFSKSHPKYSNQFINGSPFVIDSALQSMQLIIPQDLSLPMSIEEINIDVRRRESKIKRCIIKSEIKKISNELNIGNAIVFDGDNIILEIKHCNLKILRTLLDRPSANDLVEPSRRDQSLIYDKLKLLSDGLKFQMPVIKCIHDYRLRDATKKDRHEIELPLIERSVSDVLKNGDSRNVPEKIEIKWSKSGKPIVHGGAKTKKKIDVSVTHDGAFLMITAGYGTQGCDVQHVKQRTAAEWLALLGKERNKLLKELVDKGSDINEAGTAIWCAVESVRKYQPIEKFDLNVLRLYEDAIVFKSSILDRSSPIITFPITLTRNDTKTIALIVRSTETQKNNLDGENEGKKTTLKQLGYNEKAFSISIDDTGPQGQFAYVQRFPITFKNNQSLSRRVYFTNYFDWIGEIRERSLYPIMKKISGMAETGSWGLSTNSVKTQILGELGSHDVVEVHFWLEKVSGVAQGTLDLNFEWKRVLDDGKYERVALSALRATWIQITGHGEVKIGVVPDFMKNFIDTMRPKNDTSKPLKSLPEPLGNFSLGQEIISFSEKLQKKILLHEEIFQTTLEDSNLVGNIYFSNYSKWLGRTLDLYFYNLVPEYYKGTGAQGELLCLNCAIEHLQEAMPFDKILVKMYLESVYECGVNLYFEYFRLNKDNSKIKLAFARHRAVWVKRDKELNPVAANLPPSILKGLEQPQHLKGQPTLIKR